VAAQSELHPSTNNGLKLGDARVHPFFDLEGRYDSTAGLFPDRNGNVTLSPEFVTHFRPGLRLELPSPNLDLNLTGEVDYVLYTGAITPSSTKASHLEALADFTSAINKEGAVEVDIADHFTRSDRTANVAAALGFVSLYNEVRLGVPVHPGGRALEITPKGAFAIENFSPLISGTVNPICPTSSNACDFSALNYQNVQGGLEGRWRFLPKTAVIVEGTFDYRKYANNTPPPTKLIKATAGLAGLISSKLTVVAKAGYGSDSSGTGAKAFLAQLELGYLLTDVSAIHVGYLRNVLPVSYYGAFGDDRGYLNGSFLLNGHLTLHLYAAFDYFTYYTGIVGGSRNDRVGTIDLGPEYEFTNWFRVSAGYNLQARSTTASVSTPNFTRHEAHLRFTFTY
jgi:hypothetical protein